MTSIDFLILKKKLFSCYNLHLRSGLVDQRWETQRTCPIHPFSSCDSTCGLSSPGFQRTVHNCGSQHPQYWLFCSLSTPHCTLVLKSQSLHSCVVQNNTIRSWQLCCEWLLCFVVVWTTSPQVLTKHACTLSPSFDLRACCCSLIAFVWNELPKIIDQTY